MPAFLAVIPAFIAALPDLLKLGLRLMDLAVRLSALAEKHKIDEWIENVETQTDLLEAAQTSEQRRDAARGLTGAIRGLG